MTHELCGCGHVRLHHGGRSLKCDVCSCPCVAFHRASDFAAAARRLSEGFCPLCDVDLKDHERNRLCVGQDEDPLQVTNQITDAADGPFVICFVCRTGWDLTLVDNRPMLRASRPLNDAEVRWLYNREGGST